MIVWPPLQVLLEVSMIDRRVELSVNLGNSTTCNNLVESYWFVLSLARFSTHSAFSEMSRHLWMPKSISLKWFNLFASRSWLALNTCKKSAHKTNMAHVRLTSQHYRMCTRHGDDVHRSCLPCTWRCTSWGHWVRLRTCFVLPPHPSGSSRLAPTFCATETREMPKINIKRYEKNT